MDDNLQKASSRKGGECSAPNGTTGRISRVTFSSAAWPQDPTMQLLRPSSRVPTTVYPQLHGGVWWPQPCARRALC